MILTVACIVVVFLYFFFCLQFAQRQFLLPCARWISVRSSVTVLCGNG